MKKYLKIVEYVYLVLAIFLVEEIIRTWGSDQSKTFLLVALAILAFFMFFFKRWYRKKIERETSDQ